MSEQNQRKTLVSVKVSTLLLILLVVILLIVVGIVIATKLNSTEEVENKNKTSNIISNEVEEISQLPVQGENNRRKEVITSRSSEIRTEIPVITQEESIVEEVVEEPIIETTPIEEVKISKDMDLTVRTGLSRDDFILLISGVEQDTSNFFEENAGLIYDLCEKYQLNEIFFCGLISAESGWNIASNHRNTHNYISLMSGSGLIKFASVEEGLEKAAQTLHDNYLSQGGRFYYGPTLVAMKTKFCPASSTWVNLVYQRMDQILK